MSATDSYAPFPAGSAAHGPAAAERRVRLALVLLLATTFVLGHMGIAAVRPAFLLGCLVVGILAWKSGPARHIEAAVVLFILAPFLRRVVDSVAGYEPSGLMLTGPLLVLLVPATELPTLLRARTAPWRSLLPELVVAICVGITALQTFAQGAFADAASASLKWLAPLAYGMWLRLRARGDAATLSAMTNAFLLLMPIAGIYGVFQYVAPLDWDRYWMVSSQMNSIGQPAPYEVRVFSTMNSPASFATFAACGILLCGFCRRSWQAAAMALPCLLGLLLSLYRTAWLDLLAGLGFCALMPVARGRATLIVVLVGVLAGAATLTPFGDVILDRISTFSDGAQDGSAQERLAEYVSLYAHSEDTLLGSGFGARQAVSMPVDGLIITCWLQMGLVLGLVCLLAVIWAGVSALLRIPQGRDRNHAVLGAVVLGGLLQIPLTGVTTGEMGFLFWSALGIVTAGTADPRRATAPWSPFASDPATPP